MKMNGQGGSRMHSGKWSAHFCSSKELPDFVVVVYCLCPIVSLVLPVAICGIINLNNIESLLNKN